MIFIKLFTVMDSLSLIFTSIVISDGINGPSGLIASLQWTKVSSKSKIKVFKSL